MILPVFRTANVEHAANLLAKNFRQVLVDCIQYATPPIRFRADKITATRVYFAKVNSQITLWQNNGGVLIRWERNKPTGPYEAILYNECPRSIEFVDRFAEDARWLIVVRQPVTWKPHFDSVKWRCEKKPHRLRRYLEAVERAKQLIESSPRFTPEALANLLLVRQGQIARPSSFPVLPEVGGRVSGIARIAP